MLRSTCFEWKRQKLRRALTASMRQHERATFEFLYGYVQFSQFQQKETLMTNVYVANEHDFKNNENEKNSISFFFRNVVVLFKKIIRKRGLSKVLQVLVKRRPRNGVSKYSFEWST